MGPILLRDLLGTRAGREQKTDRIQEVLDLPATAVRPDRRLGGEGPRSTPTSSRPTPDEFSPCTSARYGSTQGTVALSRSPAPGRATYHSCSRRTATPYVDMLPTPACSDQGSAELDPAGSEDAKTLACLHRSGAHRLGVSDGT